MARLDFKGKAFIQNHHLTLKYHHLTVDFSATHDFLLVYARERKFSSENKAIALLERTERTEEQNKFYKNPDNDPRGS